VRKERNRDDEMQLRGTNDRFAKAGSGKKGGKDSGERIPVPRGGCQADHRGLNFEDEKGRKKRWMTWKCVILKGRR
jgi:hypothetical protein